MYVRRKIRWSIVWAFAWRNIARFTLWSTAIVAAHRWLHAQGLGLGLPFLPISTIGIAVAFYAGFKNSQSYDRFWEGRKIWGGIVNASRAFANEVLSYVGTAGDAASDEPQLAEARKRLIYRHLAWTNALRLQLRRTTIFDRDNLSFVPDLKLAPDRDCTHALEGLIDADEMHRVLEQQNTATQLLRNQGAELRRLWAEKALGDLRHTALMKTIADLYDLQGRAERIKSTPFPRQYAYFSAVFVWIFVALLPFGLLNEFQKLGNGGLIWLTVPFAVLISWIFTTVEIVGDNSEDPFENYINDVPMSAICRTIEIDLRQMLGEKDTPPPLRAVNDVLM